MRDEREPWSRREFVGALAGAVGALGPRPEPAAAEPPPETKRLRLINRPVLCEAPQYVAEELLQAEGFTDVRYLKKDLGASETALAAGEADITILFGPPVILKIDAGEPMVCLAGVHVGCAELFAIPQVRAVRDLKGKRVAIPAFREGIHAFLFSILAHIGLRPQTDVNWTVHPVADWPRLLTEGKIDAFLGFPPLAQAARAQKIGHVILSMLTDRPWSQYFCCMIVGHREFVRRHPVATKRAVRAILKASELCAVEPEKVARSLVDKGYVERSDYAVQALRDVAYGKWREYDPTDAIRFYALRLHEAGLIKSSPQKILADGTGWRFLNELKRELKG